MNFPRLIVIGIILVITCFNVSGENSLHFITPEEIIKVPYKIDITKGGAFSLELNKNKYLFTSKFSLIPGWANFDAQTAEGFKQTQKTEDGFIAETGSFKVTRTVKKFPECIEITDIITNKTNDKLPVIYRNETVVKKFKEYYMSGFRQYGRRGKGNDCKNPTVICLPREGGAFGMVALSDAFRVHFRGYKAKDIYGIGDSNLVLAPKAKVTMRWAVFITDKSDYFAIVNAIRRFWNVNYKINGSLAWINLRHVVKNFDNKTDSTGVETTVEQLREYLKNHGAKYALVSNFALKEPPFHYGSSWLKHRNEKVNLEFNKKLRKADPAAIRMHYFHCYLDHIKGMDKSGKFDNDKTLLSSGKQADYRNPLLPLFTPFIGSPWARMQEQCIDILLNKYKVDGIFWDEFAHSAAAWHYGSPWDNVSGDIDPRTHKLIRTKSSVTLLSLPWRAKQIKYIGNKDKYLMVNGGGSATETMRKLFNKYKIVGFTETDSVANSARAILGTPVGLGDLLSERKEIDAYNNMVALLDYGTLYYWYYYRVPCTHPTLTSYMFPITPVRLGKGFVMGKERIIISRSGYYSFGGMEEAHAHFFNNKGYEVRRKLESITKNGKKYYKIVLGKNESCALVKGPAKQNKSISLPVEKTADLSIVPAKTEKSVKQQITAPAEIEHNKKTVTLLCPLKADPPPAIDGDLREWQQLPGMVEINGSHIRFNKSKWKNEDDLSGTLRVAWDENYFYVVTEVYDDIHEVNESGKKLWLSDHVELRFDTKWQKDIKGNFGNAQFMIGFSPGNFDESGDPMNAIDSEFYVYQPEGIGDNAEIDVAAKKTEAGYNMEIRIPWTFFKVKAKKGMVFGMDFSLSDNENGMGQKSMTSLYPGAWSANKRERMIMIKLGNTKGE